MNNIIAQHTNKAGDNKIYQDDVTGIVTVDTKFPGETEFTPNTKVIVEYKDDVPPTEDRPGGDYIEIDFNEQQIVDMKFINAMSPLPELV